MTELTDLERWQMRALSAEADLARGRAEVAVAALRTAWQTVCAAHGLDPDLGYRINDDGTVTPAGERTTP